MNSIATLLLSARVVALVLNRIGAGENLLKSAFEETRLEEIATSPTRFHICSFQNFRYVYPVISRRARGVSVGINLSPTKICNFRCVYCQVERDEKTKSLGDCRLDLDALRTEILTVSHMARSGKLFEQERFVKVPAERRVLRDFAFSGDGEPTLAPQFPEAVEMVATAREALGDESIKIVLITNATRLQEPSVVAALDSMVNANGEIWAKLDAGDEARFRRIDRSHVPLETILDNVLFAGRRWGVKIQTSALAWQGVRPTSTETDAYCARLNALVDAGARISEVQLYTVARKPVEVDASALSDEEMDALGALIHEKTSLPVATFYSK